MRRERVEVRWDAQAKVWWFVIGGQRFSEAIKVEAIYEAATYCQLRAGRGHHLELIIKNKNGQIGKGSSSRRTYGADPRRTRG